MNLGKEFSIYFFDFSKTICISSSKNLFVLKKVLVVKHLLLAVSDFSNVIDFVLTISLIILLCIDSLAINAMSYAVV